MPPIRTPDQAVKSLEFQIANAEVADIERPKHEALHAQAEAIARQYGQQETPVGYSYISGQQWALITPWTEPFAFTRADLSEEQRSYRLEYHDKFKTTWLVVRTEIPHPTQEDNVLAAAAIGAEFCKVAFSARGFSQLDTGPGVTLGAAKRSSVPYEELIPDAFDSSDPLFQDIAETVALIEQQLTRTSPSDQ